MKKCGVVLLALVVLALSCTADTENLKKQSEASRSVGEAYIQQGNYTMALRELMKAEQFYADDPDLQNDLGYVYMQKKRLDLAIEHFKKALELKADFASAKNNLGVAYLEQKKWDAAIVCFKELTENLVYTTPQKPLVNLGWAYYNKKEYSASEKYYNEALTLYREGVVKDQDYLKAVYGISQIYLSTGRTARALPVLQQGLKDAPRAYPLYFNLAEAYTLLKDYDKAYQAYKKVIELAPDSDLGKRAEVEARKIEGWRKTR